MTHNRPTQALFPAIVQTSQSEESGEGVLKRTIALCACLLAVNVAANAGDLVQAPPTPALYPGVAYPQAKLWLPPHEITAIVRSIGLKPLHRPARHGATYAVRALAPTGEEVRVILDARVGIVRIDPVRMPIYAMPATPHGPRLGMVPTPDRPALLPSPRPERQTRLRSGGHGRNHRVSQSAACASRAAGVTSAMPRTSVAAQEDRSRIHYRSVRGYRACLMMPRRRPTCALFPAIV